MMIERNREGVYDDANMSRGEYFYSRRVSPHLPTTTVLSILFCSNPEAILRQL